MLPRQQFGGPYGTVKVEAQAANRAAAQLKPVREGALGQIVSFLYHFAVVALLGVTVGLLATISSRPEVQQSKGVCQPSPMTRLNHVAISDLVLTLPGGTLPELQQQAIALLPTSLQPHAEILNKKFSASLQPAVTEANPEAPTVPENSYLSKPYGYALRDQIRPFFATDYFDDGALCHALQTATQCTASNPHWQANVMRIVVDFASLQLTMQVDPDDETTDTKDSMKETMRLAVGLERKAMMATISATEPSPCVWSID